MNLFVVLLASSTISSHAISRPSCTGFQCPPGNRCEMQIASCFVPPCFPAPICVINTTACILPCPDGQSCVWERVHCKDEYCPSKPVCKEDQKRFPKTCKEVYCRGDTKCTIRKGEVRDSGPVCIPRSSSDPPIAMGTMPPSVTCETLGCPPGERCVQKTQGPQCEPVKCNYGEVYDRCFNGCEATCDNFGPLCSTKCGPGGCKCSMGYYRYPSGECEMECPEFGRGIKG